MIFVKISGLILSPLLVVLPVVSHELLLLSDLQYFCFLLFPNREVMGSRAQEVSKGCLGKKVTKDLEASLAPQAPLDCRYIYLMFYPPPVRSLISVLETE